MDIVQDGCLKVDGKEMSVKEFEKGSARKAPKLVMEYGNQRVNRPFRYYDAWNVGEVCTAGGQEDVIVAEEKVVPTAKIPVG